MLQPFVMFREVCLDRLILLKKIYLVSQTYERGNDHFEEVQKRSILLSDYDNLGQANMHLNAIKNDRYAAIIDLSKSAHLEKLSTMMNGEQYKIYWAVIKSKEDIQKRLDTAYKTRLRKYIDAKTTWNISSGEKLTSQFEVTFGEIFLILKWRSQKVRLKFEEIERY